jgi:hypothetical protein
MDTRAPDTCRRPLIPPDPCVASGTAIGGEIRIRKRLKNFQEGMQNFF